MASGPQGPSRLTRVANVPFNRLAVYLDPMISKGLVRKGQAEGRDVYAITQEGMEALRDLDRVLPKLLP